jgi:hypothetical protein
VARWKALAAALAALTASAIVLAAAPAPGRGATPSATRPAAAGTGSTAVAAAEIESNEQIVADFLRRKQKAEKAQRAIILSLRRELDRKRSEFELARKRFDEARGCYAEIVGPLARQGVMNPDDPRLPYEYDVRRWGAEPGESRAGYTARQPAETGRK